MSVRFALRGGTLLLTLIGVVILIRATGLDAHLDETWIDTYVRGRGAAGMLVFVAAGGLFTAVGMPRQLIAFLGGYAFGIVEGTALTIMATVAGCVVSFYYARFLGRDLVAGRFPGKVKRIDDFLAENPFTMTLLIRFLPVGSNVLTNLAAGVTSVPGLPYLAGSAIGYLPQTLIFALIGTGIKVNPAANIALAAGLFVLSGILGVYLYRRHRHGKVLDEELDEEIGGADPTTAD
ncbi:MAG: SNARE associated Golgi protein [Rhodospirillales bacterium CG15_BIG_FIL_POST_REV_8_21_14_020_66_15]|nr:MAG: SNARE associated Golgi protein [Rhodospirillales bacterium CG15_BIG_FIL_POST_REV_8_21_14_020_66_15]